MALLGQLGQRRQSVDARGLEPADLAPPYVRDERQVVVAPPPLLAMRGPTASLAMFDGQRVGRAVRPRDLGTEALADFAKIGIELVVTELLRLAFPENESHPLRIIALHSTDL